jgi:hypothetical protein
VGSGSVSTHRSKCLSVSFRLPSFPSSVCMCACVCFCLNFVFFCVLGRDKDTINLSQFFLSKQNFTKFSNSLAVAFLFFWMSSSTYFFGFFCLFVCFASSNPCMKLVVKLGTVL